MFATAATGSDLGTARPEPGDDAVPQRIHALPDEVHVGVGQHRSRLRVNPARSSHRFSLVRQASRGLTAPDGAGQGRSDVKDKGLGPTIEPMSRYVFFNSEAQDVKVLPADTMGVRSRGDGGEVAGRHDAAGAGPGAGPRDGAEPAGLALFHWAATATLLTLAW